jgi:sterol 3beta-glucosyltransferase
VHLVIATVGTRGDVQPYVAVGVALRDQGHVVTVATHEDHRALVEMHGLAFRGVCGSFRELLASPAGVTWLESSDRPRAYLRAFRELFSQVAEDWLDQFDAAYEDADAVLVHSIACGAIVALERRSVPHVVLSPFAAAPSKELDLGGLPRVPLITGVLERLGHQYLLDQVWKVAEAGHGRFRRQHGLALPGPMPWRRLLSLGVGHLHLFSELVTPRPSDWPPCAEVTGYCFLDAVEEWQPPPSLVDFLSSGEPPVYVGFGSMTGMDPEKLATLTHAALRASGQRAVIGMGWGGLAGFQGDDDTLIVDDVPHDWLFPRVAAVVHHGGAGTTAAALRAGKPSVVVPFFADQPYWARRLARLGVATRPVPKRKLTAPRLAAALQDVRATPAFARAADALGAKIRAENGAASAARRALHYLIARA